MKLPFSILFFLLSGMGILFLGCVKDEIGEGNTVPDIPVEIVFHEPAYNISLGDSITIYYRLVPDTVKLNDLQWSSSDTTVATVSSSGMLLSKNPGRVIITLESRLRKTKATIPVTVLPRLLNAIEWENKEDSIVVAIINEPKQLQLKYIPENAIDKYVYWKAVHPDNLAVDSNGVVTVHRFGYSFVEAYRLSGGIYKAAVIVPGTRSLGIAVSYTIKYSPHDERYFVEFYAGALDLPVAIRRVDLYTTERYPRELKDFKQYSNLRTSLQPGKARRVWRQEVTAQVANELYGGSAVVAYYSVNGGPEQNLIVLL